MNDSTDVVAGGYVDVPKVCVVTVCRNALDALISTEASVASQLYEALHYVVIDGASTDGTVEFLKSNPPRVDDWMSEPDAGIYEAMNKAIDHCFVDSWVLFLNAGDCFKDSKVLVEVSKVLTEGVDIVFGDVTIRSPGGGTHLFKARCSKNQKMPGCHQSMLVRARLLRALRFDTSYRVGADFDFYLRSVRNGARIAIYEGVISDVAPEGYSADNEHMLQRDYARAIEMHSGRFSSLLWLARRKVRRAIRRLICK